MRDWSRDEIIAEIVRLCDEQDIPRRLGVGAGIAESNLRQYAERYGYHTNEGSGYALAGDLMGLQRVLDEMRSDGTPYDCSFGIGQQIVAFCPVGDKTMTPENVLVCREWLFDPANALPLMVGKLTLFFHDPNNPGTDEQGRILYSLAKYNTGRFVMPAGEWAGNVANYQRGLALADAALENFFPEDELTDKERADIRLQLDVLFGYAGRLRAKRDKIAAENAVIAIKDALKL